MNRPTSARGILLIAILLGGCQSVGEPPPWVHTLSYAPDEVREIRIGRYGYPYLGIEIDEQPVVVFLDTGNMSGLFLSAGTIERLNLERIGGTVLYDSDGEPMGTRDTYRAETVDAFDSRWIGPTILERTIRGTNGAIGPTYLVDRRFTLDYTRRLMGVCDRPLIEPPREGETFQLVPVADLKGMIVVRGELAGEEVLIQIDTGKSRTCIDPDFAVRAGLHQTSGGYRIDGLRIGSFTFDVPSAKAVRFRGISHGLDRPIEIGLGSDMLDEVVLTVDYHRSIVVLQNP